MAAEATAELVGYSAWRAADTAGAEVEAGRGTSKGDWGSGLLPLSRSAVPLTASQCHQWDLAIQRLYTFTQHGMQGLNGIAT